MAEKLIVVSEKDYQSHLDRLNPSSPPNPTVAIFTMPDEAINPFLEMRGHPADARFPSSESPISTENKKLFRYVAGVQVLFDANTNKVRSTLKPGSTAQRVLDSATEYARENPGKPLNHLGLQITKEKGNIRGSKPLTQVDIQVRDLVNSSVTRTEIASSLGLTPKETRNIIERLYRLGELKIRKHDKKDNATVAKRREKVKALRLANPELTDLQIAQQLEEKYFVVVSDSKFLIKRGEIPKKNHKSTREEAKDCKATVKKMTNEGVKSREIARVTGKGIDVIYKIRSRLRENGEIISYY